MVRDELTGNDYKLEEDPHHYVSKKTGRGPLHDDWVACPPHGVIMCAYKLVKVSRSLVPRPRERVWERGARFACITNLELTAVIESVYIGVIALDF